MHVVFKLVLTNQCRKQIILGIRMTFGIYALTGNCAWLSNNHYKGINTKSKIWKLPSNQNLSACQFSTTALAITCADPGVPQHGSRNGSGDFKYGAKVSFRCNKGYIIYGSYERSCGGEGEWTGVQPYCVGKNKIFHSFLSLGS